MASDDIFEDDSSQKKIVQKSNKESVRVDHPAHYNSGKIEVIDAIEDWNLNFSRGNAIKYIARAGLKDKSTEVEDLQKALWYIQREIQRLS